MDLREQLECVARFPCGPMVIDNDFHGPLVKGNDFYGSTVKGSICGRG